MKQKGRIMSTIVAATKCTWTGASGRAYTFTMHRKEHVVTRSSCVYILAAPGQRGDGSLGLRVGETSDIVRRLDEHRRNPKLMRCLSSHGWSHVGILVKGDENERREIETDIRNSTDYSWPCDEMA